MPKVVSGLGGRGEGLALVDLFSKVYILYNRICKMIYFCRFLNSANICNKFYFLVLISCKDLLCTYLSMSP